MIMTGKSTPQSPPPRGIDKMYGLDPSSDELLPAATRNWIMATLWDPEVASAIHKCLRVTESSLKCSKKKLIQQVNGYLETMSGYEAKIDPNQDIVVAHVKPEYFDFGHLDIEELEMTPASALGPKAAVKSKRNSPGKIGTITLYYLGELRVIMNTIVDKYDLLIIAGGYQVDRLTPDGLELKGLLNAKAEERTIIIRVPAKLVNRDPCEVSLVEIIKPNDHIEGRFFFKYLAKRGGERREVIQNREFSYAAEFLKFMSLKHVAPTWDFPKPIIRGINPELVMKTIFSPEFKMPPSPIPKSKSKCESGTYADLSELDESDASVDTTASTSSSIGFFFPEKKNQCAQSFCFLTLTTILFCFVFFILAWICEK